MKSPEYGPASAAMSTRRPEPKQFEAEYFTYLTPESFTILPPDENTPTPSPPRVPDPNKLTPRKRRKNQAFAIIAEPHSPNNSRSASPTGGRVSPFRGRGFNPTGSRHASPTSSPPLLLSPTKPPRTSSILRVSQIPKPILIRRSSVEDVLSPESSPTSQQRHNRRQGNSNLNVKHSRSMSNIAPRHLSAKPPPSPRRVSTLKTSFVRLSPIIGSSPETCSDPIPSSPSRIPRSKSQPPSRLTSPNVSRAPSRNTSRPTSRNASRNASRETSPNRSPSKIPMKSSAYKNIPAKIDTFSRIANISKPKVPQKPKVYSTRSSVGDRSTKPMVRKNVNRSTSSVSRRDADDTETTDTDRETVRGGNVRSLQGRTHSRLEINRELRDKSASTAYNAKQERTRHDSEKSSILRTHSSKTKSDNPEQSTSGHYSKGQDKTKSDGRSNGNEGRSNDIENRNNETGSRNNETGSKSNETGSRNNDTGSRNNDTGSRNNGTGNRSNAAGSRNNGSASRTNGSESRSSGIGMGNRSGVGNNSKQQSSSGYRRVNGAKSTKGQDTTTTSTTEDLSKTEDDETTEDAKDDDILSVTIENIGGISTTQIVSATTETIVKPLNIESNRNKHSDNSSQAGGMNNLQSSDNNDNTRRSVTPTRNRNSNQNIHQNERHNQNLNQNQSMNQNERQNQNLNQNERQNERQNQNLNQNERQNQNVHNNQNQNMHHNQNLNQNSYQNNNQTQNANRNTNGNGNSHSPANGSVRTNTSDQNRILNSSTITSNNTGGTVNQVTESVNNNVNNHLSNSVSPSLNSVEMNARNNLNNLTPTDSDKVNKSLMDSAQLTNSANQKLKQARTVIVDEIRPIKITVREKSDGVEVQSGNIGMARSATNGIAERPLLPPPNNQSGDQETQESENAKTGRCAKLFACCSKKAKEPQEPQEPEAEVTIENEKTPKCWDKLQCCKSNKVYDSTKPTGCFSNWKRGKENEGSWAERRDSILSAPPKKQDRCASLKKIFCMPCSCCRKKPVVAESVSRRKSTMSKKTSLSSTMQPPPEDTGPKLDTSLVEYTSHMHGAIPILPVPLAWICLILNVILPGVGTILSGLFCLCIGIPRFSQRDGIKPRIGAFVIDIIVGISQLFTVLFCLVGWGWSIWWGVIMLKIAKKYRKIKKAEAIALKLEEDEKEREKEKEEQAAAPVQQVPSVNINHADRDIERGTT